jgi:uncharacterized membrane protein
MNTTLEELRSRGAHTLKQLYTQRVGAVQDAAPLPEISQNVRWEGAGALLLEVDLSGLRTAATSAGAVVRLHVGVGEEVTRGGDVMSIHGAADRIADHTLLQHLSIGPDRTFSQDPLLAFRLLNDIAIRALSQAVNDPASAVSAVAAVDNLLRIVADRELDIGRLADSTGHVRVVLHMPIWDDFLAAAVGDVAPYAATAPMVATRLTRLLDDLAGVVPPERRAAVELRRRQWAEARRSQQFIVGPATDRGGDAPPG